MFVERKITSYGLTIWFEYCLQLPEDGPFLIENMFLKYWFWVFVIYRLSKFSVWKEFEVNPEHQSGFRSGFSCTIAIFKIGDDIKKNSYSGLRRWFSSIIQKHLIGYYIGYHWSWCSCIISKIPFFRIQTWNQSLSDPLSISLGVPQWSLLDTLPFMIYTCGYE